MCINVMRDLRCTYCVSHVGHPLSFEAKRCDAVTLCHDAFSIEIYNQSSNFELLFMTDYDFAGSGSSGA